jgi:hypothetical protein
MTKTDQLHEKSTPFLLRLREARMILLEDRVEDLKTREKTQRKINNQ